MLYYIAFLLSLIKLTGGNEVLYRVEEKLDIPGGDYVYYNISVSNVLLFFQLTSEIGDCDLYISKSGSVPTFRNYSAISATSGEDSLTIIKRSLGDLTVGVFGHPFFEISNCTLSVCAFQRGDDGYEDELEELLKHKDVIQYLCQPSAKDKSLFMYLLEGVISILLTLLQIVGACFSSWNSQSYTLLDYILLIL